MAFINIKFAKRDRRQTYFGQVIWPRLIDVWVLGVLVTFFIIRVVGSESFEKLLSRH